MTGFTVTAIAIVAVFVAITVVVAFIGLEIEIAIIVVHPVALIIKVFITGAGTALVAVFIIVFIPFMALDASIIEVAVFGTAPSVSLLACGSRRFRPGRGRAF